jgi:peptidoglycan-associated lipoprotein
LILGVAAVTAAAGCSKRQVPEQPIPTTTAQQPTQPTNTSTGGGGNPATAEDPNEVIRRTLAAQVFFDYDQSSLRQDAQSLLREKLPILQQNTAIRLRIEGHADERGSVEYNLALGLRRAQAVKDFLANFGIDASRITVESYGEDRPQDRGVTEAAYALNRRAEFVVTAGLGN